MQNSKRVLVLSASAVALALAAAPASALAQAQARGVGLGVAGGVAFPDGDISYDPSINWGFYVDIPLVYTFHITPSTLLYRLSPKDAPMGADLSAWTTDVSLNFKFMIPLGKLELFAGLLAGVTAATKLQPHVGLLGGASFNLVSNIDIFAQVNYKLLLRDQDQGGNLRDLQVYAGPLFRFY